MDIVIPFGWDAIRGQPQFELVLPQPPTEVLLSDTMMARQLRIFQPLRVMAQLAVTVATKRSHDADEARWHANRPALKHCPYDPACRFA